MALCCRMEQHPSEAPPGASVRLAEFAAVQSILMRASIEAQARRTGWDPSTPIGEFLSIECLEPLVHLLQRCLVGLGGGWEGGRSEG